MQPIFAYGHRPDPIDLVYTPYQKDLISAHLPIISGDIDLRAYSSPRKNQGSLSCCVAESLVKALEIKHIMQHGLEHHIPLSVLDLYYGARDLMTPSEAHTDQGTQISLACEVLKRFGVCREEMWPFEPAKVLIPPPILATRESYLNKIAQNYRITSTGQDRVQDVIDILRAGNPVVFATQVSEDWMKYWGVTGPDQSLGPVTAEEAKGGHAICCVGWVKDKFVIENSWGDWGDNGYAYLQPEVLMAENSLDFWMVTTGSEAWYEGQKVAA